MFTTFHKLLQATRVCATWIRRVLTPEQKKVREDVCKELQVWLRSTVMHSWKVYHHCLRRFSISNWN